MPFKSAAVAYIRLYTLYTLSLPRTSSFVGFALPSSSNFLAVIGIPVASNLLFLADRQPKRVD